MRLPIHLRVVFLLYVTLFAFGMFVSRADAAGMSADAQCVPVKQECFCGMFLDPQKGCIIPGNKFMCPCSDSTNGFTTSGICTANFKCSAQSSDGMPPMLPMPPMPMPKPSMPMPPQDPCASGGSGGIVTSMSTSSAASSTCPGGSSGSSFPPTSSSIDFTPFNFNTSSTTIPVIPDMVSSLIGDTTSGASSDSSDAPLGPDYTGGTTGSAEGLAGDIIIKGTAVTAILNSRDSAKKTEFAAFYGLDSIQGEASTLITALCAIRPWAVNFLSKFASANVFDSICTFRGYKPPSPPPAPVVKKSTTPTTTKASAPLAPKVPAQADIWAVPASIPSGGRTSIFWSAKGVDTCEESSSDKTFSHATLSGSSPTSPLTSPVTFTISCTNAAGDRVVNAVTVTVQ